LVMDLADVGGNAKDGCHIASIGLEKVEYRLREGACLVIRHETEEAQLTRKNSVIVRPVSRW
jgi:hypothetical protein